MQADPVLIIEDDPEFLKLLTIFVKENGCPVVTGATAEEGLAKFRIYDLNAILLDIMLPDGNGIDVLRKIHKISPRLPVIMITGKKDIETATECMRNGAVDYITKPVDFEYLRTALLSNVIESLLN